MKSKILKILCICMVITALSACTNNKEKIDKDTKSSSAEPVVSSAADEPSKYGEVPVYKNNDGKPTAKTESGEEVEITGESMQEIYAQYEKVRGTGSQEERDLLDKLQLILEAPKK